MYPKSETIYFNDIFIMSVSKENEKCIKYRNQSRTYNFDDRSASAYIILYK